jgi:hypothetical protein
MNKYSYSAPRTLRTGFKPFYLFFLFYLFQSYSTDWSNGAKRLVLALRYFIPLLPVLC